MNYWPIFEGLLDFWEGLQSHTWPQAFFLDSLGLTEELTLKLPQYAKTYLGIYFVMAAVSLVLHYWKKQKSLSNFGRKFTDFLLTILLIPAVRAIILIFGVGQEKAMQVKGSFSFTPAGEEWMMAMVEAWYYPVGLSLILLGAVLVMCSTVKRYLEKYNLAGIPWAIYDVGFGLFCISTLLMVLSTGNPDWYWLILPAVILNAVGQTGGVDIGRDEKNND